MEREEEKEILGGIFNQIASFDNKANILISVMGIIFAISISFLSVASDKAFIDKSNTYILIYNVIFIIFTLNMIISVLLFILVILPRKHKDDIIYANYYMDIYNLSRDEFNKYLDIYTKDNNYLVDQILINASVCRRKHRFLTLGIISLIPAAIELFILIILIII